MRTTIKLSSIKRLIVEPCRHSDLTTLTVQHGDDIKSTEAIYLTPDQVGALLVALEFAGAETPAAAVRRQFEEECA